MKKWQRQFVRKLREMARFEYRKLLCFDPARRREISVSAVINPPPTRVTWIQLRDQRGSTDGAGEQED